MDINIGRVDIHVTGRRALLEAATALSELLSRREDAARTPSQPTAVHACARRCAIGEAWPGQGGIYVGDQRGGVGLVYGLIAAPDDAGEATWGPSGKSYALSDWDGLQNTLALQDDSPAARMAADYSRDGHHDFYLPAQRELLLASANVRDLIGPRSWVWSSTPYGEETAWAVDFDYGGCRSLNRISPVRVRPFRRFLY